MSRLKVIYEPKGKAKEYADLAANFFATCSNACEYCFVPAIMDKEPEDFFTPVTIVRTNVIINLASDADYLKCINEEREILLCFTCDSYQNDSKVCVETTRAALDVLLNAGLNITVLTKGGNRSLRDIDLFETYKDQFRYGTTLVFSNDSDSLEHEPYAAPTSERINAMAKIYSRGIRTWVSIEPAWSIEDTINIIDRTHKIVDEYKIGKLNYHPHADDVDWEEYTKVVVAHLKKLNKNFYVKEDLKQYVEKEM